MNLGCTISLALLSFLVQGTFALLLDDRQPCTLCGPPIDVSLTAANNFRLPYFNITVMLQNTAKRELIHLLQEAADQDGRFNFTVSYSGRLGFFVETINHQKGDYAADRSWWHVYSDQLQAPGGKAHCEGVSSYVPGHKESVVFLLTDQVLHLPECPELAL